jgi:hypothetical protein
MVYCLPLNVTCLPTDLSDATGINSVTGKLRSSSTLRISLPTKPVAPTTAIFMMILALPPPMGECFRVIQSPPLGIGGYKKIVTVKVKNLDKHAGKSGSISRLAPRVYLDFFVFTVTIKMWVQNNGIIISKSRK